MRRIGREAFNETGRVEAGVGIRPSSSISRGRDGSRRPARPDQVRAPGRCAARSARPRASRPLRQPHRASESGVCGDTYRVEKMIPGSFNVEIDHAQRPVIEQFVHHAEAKDFDETSCGAGIVAASHQ